jgi:hypothetical protein
MAGQARAEIRFTWTAHQNDAPPCITVFAGQDQIDAQIPRRDEIKATRPAAPPRTKTPTPARVFPVAVNYNPPAPPPPPDDDPARTRAAIDMLMAMVSRFGVVSPRCKVMPRSIDGDRGGAWGQRSGAPSYSKWALPSFEGEPSGLPPR